MKTSLVILVTIFFVSNCSSEKSSKPAPSDQPEPNIAEVGTPVPSASPTPLPTPTPKASPVPNDSGNVTPAKTKSTFSLFTLTAQESNRVRSAGKIVSVSINPVKVTSLTALIPSLMTVYCSNEVIAQTKVELQEKDRENEPAYRPSVLIPADAACNTEMQVKLDVFGFEVELGDVIVADAVFVGKASLVQ
ncbi:MAG TPA: hypothetical protein VE954_11260 [Oligoflexus sp.]|uniref:hypothetical protein n=1 Tax=Oligoflexus sp. TaxID=1971216 RepID=UPI002D3CFBA3|nr:hypothetical protein [Oligoflexus sp.]HYX33683.1 hypothetical protein [Oligoflexus sp.]